MQDMLLMSKDTPVMRINFDTGIYDVITKELVPYNIRCRLVPMSTEVPSTRYELTQYNIKLQRNYNAVIDWLANRVLLLSRKNAKWIYNALNIEQCTDNVSRAKVAITCRAVSLLDTYWIKVESDAVRWKDVNLRDNQLNEIIAQIALHGKSLTVQGSLTTPELTTNGSYAKAWRRHEDGQLWLHKLGDNGSYESKIEVMVSNLLDKMNVHHVYYEAGEDEGKYVCMCPCMSTDDVGILTGMEFNSYFNAIGEIPNKMMLQEDVESLYKMWIVDYLISNRDRHGQNWGYFYDLKTMRLLGHHPLFDHNNAFDIEWMQDDDAKYQFGDYTIKQAAKLAMSKVDFCFTEPITRSDFLTDRQYESFARRARELGVETKMPTFEVKFDKLICAPYCSKVSEKYGALVEDLYNYSIQTVRKDFGIAYLQTVRDDILLGRL